MLGDPIPGVPQKRSKERPGGPGRRPRRRYTLSFILQVVNETFAPGASVTEVALRHNMNTNVIFRWRKQFREGLFSAGTAAREDPPPQFIPVHVVPDAQATLPAPQTPGQAVVPASKPASCGNGGMMELTLPGGFALHVDAGIDDATLRRVLKALRDMS
jgi:transposase